MSKKNIEVLQYGFVKGEPSREFIRKSIETWRWRIVKNHRSISRFCNLYGFNQESISRYINNVNKPMPETFKKIENAIRASERISDLSGS